MPPASNKVENNAAVLESNEVVDLRNTGSQKRKLYETNLAKNKAKL